MQAWQQIQQENRCHLNFSEVWQVGGDAYTAVAVAKKTGTGSWVVYNIFRDHLGTITHLKNGSTIDEYSFDSWGRRRDKDDWSYTLSGEPALFADRGFAGTRSVSSGFGESCEAKTDERTNPAECSESGKFLSDFNLYNMPARLSSNEGGNGRLYDPVVGRFLSPDPYIADPAYTQSYNRYSYVLNNPLKYNDPTGELPAWALWGIATGGNWLLGGLDNWINKGMSFKQSFSTAYNPIVFSGNYHPGSNSWSNSQVNAHQLLGSMANAERGVHNHIAGFSGVGRNGEGPLFATTPLPQFVGESPLAYGVAQGGGSNHASFAPPMALPGALALEGAGVAVSPLVIVGAMPFALSGDTKQEHINYSYVVYIKTQPLGITYVGRTSGVGTPDEVVRKRDVSHHMNSLGYGPAIVHSALMNVGSLQGYPAMRGREQKVLDFYGGVGATGNSIRAVSPYNPLGIVYWKASNIYFGPLMPYNGF